MSDLGDLPARERRPEVRGAPSGSPGERVRRPTPAQPVGNRGQLKDPRPSFALPDRPHPIRRPLLWLPKP